MEIGKKNKKKEKDVSKTKVSTVEVVSEKSFFSTVKEMLMLQKAHVRMTCLGI